MPETKSIRLASAAKEFNVATATIVEHLSEKGFDVANRPTTKLTEEQYNILVKEFHKDKGIRERAEQISIGNRQREGVVIEESKAPAPRKEEKREISVRSNLASSEEPAAAEAPAEKPAPAETPAAEASEAKEEKAASIDGPKVVGKVDLDSASKGRAKKAEEKEAPKEESKAEETPEAEEPAAPVAKEKPAAKKAEPKKAEEAPKAEAAEKKEAAKPAAKAKEEKAPAKEAAKPAAKKPAEKAAPEEDKVIRPERQKLDGPKVIGKIELPADKKPDGEKRKKRKRIVKTRPAQGAGQGAGTQNRGGGSPGGQRGPGGRGPGGRGPGGRGPGGPGGPGGRRGGQQGNRRGRREQQPELTEKQIREQIKNTMARLSSPAKGKSQRSKLRRAKRDDHAQRAGEEAAAQDSNLLQVTEFISVAEIASLMDVTATQVISTCMNLGIIVSINQRLDAEVIELVADEFGYQVEFIDAATSLEEEETEEVDDPESLEGRPPIVTIMGHVDHGKTSLLDHIREANVVAGEKGGITQHIGAYEVELPSKKKIAFLDTPGHEAFTAMRARGAKVTDIAVIIVAADDAVMPQTKEAISHAQAAGVPMVFAINKIDKVGSNPDKIKEQLAGMNILVEDWGGKFQVQNVSAHTGEGIDELLEKILLEAELLELKANPDKYAVGTVVEASLDKGRGYVANIMVQEGTLKVGDMVLAGPHFGKVKAMFNERNQKIEEAGPSTPVLLLGLNGAPQAGEKFKVYESEQEVKQIAQRRAQLEREQGIRTQKHLTLDEIGRRLALGSFKELNVIIKGDVDGSVEALTDSLQKLSTEEIQVNVVHRAVGQITESDVLLATASDAIIIGFQVRPSLSARRLAEKEQVEIRLYSIIYDAIEQIKAAMEGMLDARIEEKIVCNIEIRETFKISKVGTIAGCYVLDGKINRNTKVRVIRDGIVTYTGELASLKRFKDDVKEVSAGMECGLNIQNFNDIKVGDIIEGYEEVEVKRKL
jgi:translation initiation factor IF-2